MYDYDPTGLLKYEGVTTYITSWIIIDRGLLFIVKYIGFIFGNII